MAEPAADPDRFDAAVEAFRKRVPMSREEWDLLTMQQRERAFMVSRVSEARVLQSTFDAIDRAIAEGSTLEDFKDAVKADLIEAWGGEIPGRLETIFRTNVQTAYSEGRHAIMSSPTVKQARPYWRYDDAETDRECEICGECGGTILPADDPWWETHNPPLHHNCLSGETLVVAHDILAVFKRWYDGDALVIRTASGKSLTCTPNHPILTQGGYVAAGLLHVGGHVISDRIVEGMLGSDLDHEHVPARIDEIADAFFAAGKMSAREVPVATEDFHGDGKGSKVAVVWSDGLLLNAGDSALGQHSESLEFSGANTSPSPLKGDGSSDSFLDSSLASPDRPVGRVCSCKPLVPAHLPHGERVGLGSSADMHAGPGENSTDNVSCDLEASGDYDLGGSADVFLDDIVSVERIDFHGFVYNLQTPSGHYTASGIVVHNCECKKTALSREEAEEEGIDGKGPRIDADEGFGAEPSQDGTNWDFDLSGMDPELRAIVEDALKEAPERPEPSERPEKVERSPEREPVREPEPEPATREHTKNLESSVQDGDLSGATMRIVDDMQRNGMHVWSKDPQVSEVDFGGHEMDRKLGETDAGGHVRIDKESAAGASRFVKALSEDRAGTLNGVNRILRQRSKEISPRDWTDYTDAHGELAKDVRGLETIVHEAHHLAGPQGAGKLGAEARALNEITTEMVARKYMRERIGIRYPVQNDHLVDSSCLYGELTEGMRNAIKDVMKVDNETANAMLENASVRFKSRRDLLTDGPQVRRLFAEAFGSMKKEIEDAIHRIDYE